jgi:hypothetical protein
VRGVILVSLENASFHMIYTINWFKKCSILITVITLATALQLSRRGWGWHSCLFCHIDKLVLFEFPGIPMGDPAIVAFYDKRIYKKLRMKELSLSDPLYQGTKQHRK